VSPFPPSFSPRPRLFSESSRLLTATVRCSLSRPLCFHVLVSCPSRTIDLHVLCFQIVTNCFSRKSFPLIIICVARGCGGMSFLPNSLCKRLSLSTPLFTYSCGLFVVGRKPNSFAIKQVQTLSAKYPGMGIPDAGHREGNPPARRRVSPSPPHPLYTQYAHFLRRGIQDAQRTLHAGQRKRRRTTVLGEVIALFPRLEPGLSVCLG